jgi:hypothetical protein
MLLLSISTKIILAFLFLWQVSNAAPAKSNFVYEQRKIILKLKWWLNDNYNDKFTFLSTRHKFPVWQRLWWLKIFTRLNFTTSQKNPTMTYFRNVFESNISQTETHVRPKASSPKGAGIVPRIIKCWSFEIQNWFFSKGLKSDRFQNSTYLTKNAYIHLFTLEKKLCLRTCYNFCGPKLIQIKRSKTWKL